MTIDHQPDAPGATGDGLTAPGIQAPDPGRRRKMLASGVVVALALGLGLGALARPELAPHDSRPMRPVAQIPTPADQLQIVVAPAPPVKAPAPSGARLEVLSDEMAAAAPRAAQEAPPATLRWNATVAYNDEAVRVRPVIEADDEAPIDCGRPADREEARICADIGFDRHAGLGDD
jgi:hypothetical protein